MEAIQEQLKKYNIQQIQRLLGGSENPVTLTYLSKVRKLPISVPIWTFFYENKFYCFAGNKSKKVQAIRSGNTDVFLLIINRKAYPNPESEFIPYLGIVGEARICTHLDNPKTAWIHQRLLLKYDPHLSQGWIRELYNKIELRPEEDWLIEIVACNYFSY
ncbi:MAG: hypothetical protein ACFFE8_05095 [Candidatus Heimdallarchaeota archaeon]